LDLDIVAMGGLVSDASDPILPHPRAHHRAFVLVPLAEVAPEWVHPVLGRSVAALIAALPDQQVRAL
jgi:2-amino-4-hydroxy-6-hydroxymethyldihydropteridine diphosphokinase